MAKVHVQGREALMAEVVTALQAGADLPPTTTPAAAAAAEQKPSPGSAVTAAAAGVPGTEADSSEPEAVAEAAETTPAEAAPIAASEDAGADDPVVAKRLERIQRAEKRSRDALATERQKLDAERAEWKGRMDAAQRVEQLAARAKYDPVAALQALGLTDEDFEPAAKALYAGPPAGRKDPKLATEAAERMRLRSTGDDVAQLRQQVGDLTRSLQERDARAAQEHQVAAYLDRALKVAAQLNGEAPIVRAMLAKNPEKARARIAAAAYRLAEETGEVPEPEEVLAALEAERRAELEELGLDPAALAKPASGAAAGSPAPAKPSPSLGAGMGGPAKPRTVRSREEELHDVERALRDGRLD